MSAFQCRDLPSYCQLMRCAHARQRRNVRLFAEPCGCCVLLGSVVQQSVPARSGNFLLTGKTVSLLHPLIMFALLASTIYTGILGWKWRETRLIPVSRTSKKRLQSVFHLFHPTALCRSRLPCMIG